MAFQQLPLPVSASLPLRLVKKPSLIWVELFHVEERQQPGSFGLVSGNSPNTFTASLLIQSGCEMVRERMGAGGKGGGDMALKNEIEKETGCGKENEGASPK